MSEEIKMDWTAFNAALVRRVATSSRDGIMILAEQARGIIREGVAVTPPGHPGVPGGTRAAQQHGEAKVAADLAKLYGTPGTAFALIRDRDVHQAAAFWQLHKHGNATAAKQIVQQQIGGTYGPFDGGRLHDTQFVGGRVKGSKRRPVLYVSNPEELKAFAARQSGRVHYLASGWNEIAAKLGISLPQMITRHTGPGHAVIEISETRLRIVATNDVAYASDTGLERRLQFAIDRQASKMEAQWQNFATKQLTL
jgi:hypothetical protein